MSEIKAPVDTVDRLIPTHRFPAVYSEGPGRAPTRPLAVLKRLRGVEPSVMSVDCNPRACSIAN